MNNITSFKKEDEMIHLICRHEDYRIVVKSDVEEVLPLIARFTAEDMHTVLKSQSRAIVIQNEPSDIQHSVSVESTIFDFLNQALMFEVKGISRKFLLTNEEWSMLLSLIWDPAFPISS